MLTDIRASLATRRREVVAAACTALFAAVVYALAVLTPAGQELENALFRLPEFPTDPGGTPMTLGPPPEITDTPTTVILRSGHAAVLGGLLLLVPLARRKVSLAVWGLVTLTGSAVTAGVLKQLLPRPLLDPSALGLTADNSAPSGHATMATSLALVALVVCPAAVRYIAAPTAVALAALTSYFVQGAGWHRPSDIVTAAAVSLLWCHLASALVPGAAEDIAATRTKRPWSLSLGVAAATAAALWWAWGQGTELDALILAAAVAPCVAVVVLTHYRFRSEGPHPVPVASPQVHGEGENTAVSAEGRLTPATEAPSSGHG
ncbi:phosphatase PAP2 family protein [Streptomyces cadmiisoli]|uniref:phosphatase PAP2 family protein n=1 Tax=Streptomyces cadmiisoli TaxID=2184053 RepID=UPI003666CD15